MDAEQLGLKGIENATPGLRGFIDACSEDDPVIIGKSFKTTLGRALAAEREECEAQETDRNDEIKRLGFIMKMLDRGGSLRTEYRNVLDGLE